MNAFPWGWPEVAERMGLDAVEAEPEPAAKTMQERERPGTRTRAASAYMRDIEAIERRRAER